MMLRGLVLALALAGGVAGTVARAQAGDATSVAAHDDAGRAAAPDGAARTAAPDGTARVAVPDDPARAAASDGAATEAAPDAVAGAGDGGATAAHRDGATIAVATYGGQFGHPVLLSRPTWAGVAQLAEGDTGARAYLRANPELVIEVACDETGSPADVDTQADLAAVLENL